MTLYTDVVDVVAITTGVNPARKEVDMWPNFFTGFPFPFPSIGRANFNTLPTVAVTVGTENVTLELPNHAFRNRDYVGGFYISLRQAIPAGTTATLPILIGTNGDTRPLMAYNNEPVNIAEKDWKNNNRTEAFFDFWELLLKIIRDMICKYVDLSLNLHHEEGDLYTKRG